jgi:hypothetical protein
MFDIKGGITQHYYNLLLKPILAPTSANTKSHNRDKAPKASTLPKVSTAPKASTAPNTTVTRRVGRFTIEEEKDGGSAAMNEQVNYKGGSYKVHQGPNGGRFIRVKGNKVYLAK